jgi:hypothetical protein
MFRENDAHNQQQLYNSYTDLNPKIKKRLDESWAPIFYEHVFCKIDENPFAVLYSQDMGRTNFPVNILLSLELIKHTFDYTDETLLDQYNLNFQIMYALGMRNLGERYLADRTFYNFRRRVYQHTIEHPEEEDLIFGQFERLAQSFCEAAGISTKQQRMDSTFVMSNIKLAGRLSLAFDILQQALRSCPEEMLPEQLKEVLNPEFKTNLLFRTRSSQVSGRLQEMINLSVQLLELLEGQEDSSEINLLRRFLSEQADFDQGTKTWQAKENKEIAATSLQSAYDPDATYRNKGGKVNKGYSLNVSETCAKENPVQLITDYAIENSSVADTDMLIDRLPELKNNTDVEDIYVDGGYYGEDVEKKSQSQGVTVHYTDMTGKAPAPKKISLAEFDIDADYTVRACPEQHPALKSNYKKKNGIINAHFSLEHCQNCARKDNCPVEFQHTTAVLRVKENSIIAAHARKRIFDKPLRKEATSKRAAVEGTISSVKRAQGADKLAVRTYPKVRVVTGLKMIGHNIRQIVRFFQGKVRKSVVAKHPIGVVCTS